MNTKEVARLLREERKKIVAERDRLDRQVNALDRAIKELTGDKARTMTHKKDRSMTPSDRDEFVYEFVSDTDRSLTIEQISRGTGVSHGTVYGSMTRLEAKGVVTRRKEGKKTLWNATKG